MTAEMARLSRPHTLKFEIIVLLDEPLHNSLLSGNLCSQRVEKLRTDELWFIINSLRLIEKWGRITRDR